MKKIFPVFQSGWWEWSLSCSLIATNFFTILVLILVSAITLKPLRGEVNNIDYVVTMSPLKGDIIYLANEQLVIEVDVFAGKIGKHKDLSNFDRGQIEMVKWLAQSISNRPGLLGCSQYAASVPTKSGPRKANWWTGDGVMSAWGSLIRVG